MIPAPAGKLTEVGVTRKWLFVIALSIGVAMLVAMGLLFSSLTGRSMPLVAYLNPVTVLTVAIPYLCLAWTNVKRLLPWFVGLGLTLPVWGYYLYSAVYPDPGVVGANIGVGMLILASPFLIAPIVLGVDALQRRAAGSR